MGSGTGTGKRNKMTPRTLVVFKLPPLASLVLFPKIPNEEILGESPTSTTVNGRTILDLTKCPSYLLYVLDSPLSQ
ncbi:hypothetical protein CR513_56844, partial [Mucuna pruriens]